MATTPVDDELHYVHTGLGGDLDTILIYNLLRTHSYLAPFLEADLRKQNLTATQLNALLVLKSAGENGLMMGEIGKKLVVTKSNVTGLVDRLEKQGFVSRSNHADRRATTVRITDFGLDTLEKTTPLFSKMLANLTECFTEREKKTLIKLLSKLRRELRRRPEGS